MLKWYKYFSLSLALAFGAVGILFLFMGDDVLVFFNRLSNVLGMEQVEVTPGHFYVILAVAYMYIVAMLAFLMYRDPKNSTFPFLLINAKAASSVISIFVFIVDKHLLIYITNGIIDGLIALLVGIFYGSFKKASL